MAENRVISVSAENASVITKGVAPIQDDRVKITARVDGVIIAEADDLGVVARVEIPAENVTLADGESEFQFFISKRTLSSVVEVTSKEISITTDGQHISFNSDGTILNMQLPIFELEINSTFSDSEQEVLIETKTADQVKDMCTRLLVSRSNSKLVIPTLKLGQFAAFGSNNNVTVYKRGFAKIDSNVATRFIDFISAIYKFGENIDFIQDNKERILVVRNSKVAYKTKELEQQFPNIESILTDVRSSTTISSVVIKSSVAKLSIPLIGMVEQSITLDINEAKSTAIDVSVTDSSNNVSCDVWAAVAPKGSHKFTIDLNDLNSIVGAMDEAVEVTSYDNLTRLSDDSQDTFISNFTE